MIRLVNTGRFTSFFFQVTHNSRLPPLYHVGTRRAERSSEEQASTRFCFLYTYVPRRASGSATYYSTSGKIIRGSSSFPLCVRSGQVRLRPCHPFPLFLPKLSGDAPRMLIFRGSFRVEGT